MATRSTGAIRFRARRSTALLAALALLVALVPVAPQPASATVTHVDRGTIMARAQKWVDLHVPYSQTAWRTLSGAAATRTTGYRTDCSGFVSMTWALLDSYGRPLSLTTSTLPSVSTPITKSQLQPGDMLLTTAAAPYRHAVIFGGWYDAAKTKYYAYEESSSQKGTVKRVTPYPYWSGTPYAPWRYKNVDDDFLNYIEPVRGTNAIGTAVVASRSTFATGTVNTAVVAGSGAWRDALVGSSLAGAAQGPLLLAEPHRLRSDVRNELRRLGVKKVYVIGSAASIDASVAASIQTFATVKRITGVDCNSTATKVAYSTLAELRVHGKTYDGVAYLASSQTYADAIGASAVAAAKGRPILFVGQTLLPKVTASALGWLHVQKAYGLGGTTTMSWGVLGAADYRIPGRAYRLGGSTPYDTALVIEKHSEAAGLGWSRAGIASGTGWSDAIVAGPTLARTPSVLLLTPTASLYPAVGTAIKANAAKIGKVRCFGTFDSVSSAARKAIAVALGM